MREIKFRAWDGYNKAVKYYTLKELAQFDKFGYDTEFEAIQSGFDNWIWLQYTRLKDKNGKEIYEGDICQTVANKKLWVVEFENFAFRFNNNKVKKTDGFPYEIYNFSDYIPMLRHANTWIEVIGNIYETPELITSQKQTA